jgi:subtilase family serine protease
VTKGRSAVIVALAMGALALAGISGGTPLHAHMGFVAAFGAPESTSDCVTDFGFHCYSPAQIDTAYGLDQLHAAGIDGSGTTIAVVIPFGSPTIAADLVAFDATFGLPDPQLTIAPLGNVPVFDPTDDDALTWAEETTLDVEWSHVVAPKANILLVETAVDETEGTQGFPEIVAGEKYAVDHGAEVIVQTYGATEQTFPGPKSIMSLRDGLNQAAKQNVTVVNASGDTGTTNFTPDFDFYPMRVNGWPSADPLVTSVGGTQITLDDSGTRQAPDVVWNETEAAGGPFASGGGVSTVFNRPRYQDGVKSIVGNARGTPDVSMSAAHDGSVWIQTSFAGVHGPFLVASGTSVATPLFGGIVALADQLAGQPLGQINQALYSIPYGGGLVDVTQGDNDPGIPGAPGYDATPGYDLASGLGTVDATRFVPTLAASAGGPPNKEVDCSSALTFAAFTGNVHVRKGMTCSLTDSAVDGNLKVDDGATLVLNGVTLNRDLNVGKKATCTASGQNQVAGRVSGQCTGF